MTCRTDLPHLSAPPGRDPVGLLAAMMTLALDGDVGAAGLLLERAIAPLKAA